MMIRRGYLPTLLLALSLFAVLACTDKSEGELSGIWYGRIDTVGGKPEGTMEVDLELEQKDNRLTGTLFLRDAVGPLKPLSSKRLTIRQGLFAEGRLFINASAPIPGGNARINIYGSAGAESIDADLSVWIHNVGGDKELPGRLIARPE